MFTLYLPVKRVPDLVEAVCLGDPQVARRLVEGVLLEEEPDLVPGVQEVVILCLQNQILSYRVTHQVVQNLPFTSNQKFCFVLARPGQAITELVF